MAEAADDFENLWAPLCCGSYDVQAATAAAESLATRLGKDPGLFDKVPPKTMVLWKNARKRYHNNQVATQRRPMDRRIESSMARTDFLH